MPASFARGGRAPAAGDRAALCALAALLALAACAHPSAPYVWIDDAPSFSGDAVSAYRIREGDVLGIRVLDQDPMSLPTARVRDDGRVSLPIIQDVEVAGVTPVEAAARIRARLKKIILHPVVTVTLVEASALRVSVLGEVAKPGVYAVEGGAGVLHALAAAGGLTPFADRSAIFVLRHGEDARHPLSRIRFRFESLAGGEWRAFAFRLSAGDVVVVE